MGLLRDEDPAYSASCLSLPTPSARHAKATGPPAGRPAMPAELRQELPRAQEILEAIGIPVFELPGHPAANIMATLVEKALGTRALKILVAAGGRLVCQLVREEVRVLNPYQDNLVYDIEEVRLRFGVEPRDIPLLLALAGDKAEDLPGLAGIGEKTAAKLINRHKTLPELIARSGDIGGKTGASIQAGEERLRADARSATLQSDLPVDFDLERCRARPPDHARLDALAGRLGVLEAVSPLLTHQPRKATSYSMVLQEKELEDLVSELEASPLFSIDTETTGVDPHRAALVGISCSTRPGTASYIPLAHSYIGAPRQLKIGAVLKRLKPLLESDDGKKVGQNAKYDIHIFSRNGIHLRGLSFDTMIASYLLRPGERRNSLGAMALDHLGHKMTPTRELIGAGRTMAEVEVAAAGEYACEDADITLQIKEILEKQLRASGLEELFRTVEMPLVGVLARMEARGVAVDSAHLKKLTADLKSRAAATAEKVYKLAGQRFNIDSPRQLASIFFDKMGLEPVSRTRTGARSTSHDVLVALAHHHEIARCVLDYRTLAKLTSGYVEPLLECVNPETGRIHTSYHQPATATGRLSSSNPNLQNVPVRTELGREVRRAFVAPEGCVLLCADYNQVELRILAHLSQDEALADAFRNGRDIHTETAHRVFKIPRDMVGSEERRRAKAINFGIIYGIGPRGLSRQTGYSEAEAARFIQSYFEAHPGIRSYIDRALEDVRRIGSTRTILGRPRRFPDILSRNPGRRQAAEREAINSPVQGSAADIIKLAMIRIDRRLSEEKLGTRMIIQIHDELVFEVPEKELPAAREVVKSEMESAYALSVPLTVKLQSGPDWHEMG